jgi:hypothetical protein
MGDDLPPKNPASESLVDEILRSTHLEQPPERLQRLKLALATIDQQAKALRERVSEEMKRLGVSPPPNKS